MDCKIYFIFKIASSAGNPINSVYRIIKPVPILRHYIIYRVAWG
jgi:hypothetical protein